jgi:hypothetical protein
MQVISCFFRTTNWFTCQLFIFRLISLTAPELGCRFTISDSSLQTFDNEMSIFSGRTTRQYLVLDVEPKMPVSVLLLGLGLDLEERDGIRRSLQN